MKAIKLLALNSQNRQPILWDQNNERKKIRKEKKEASKNFGLIHVMFWVGLL